MTTSERPTVLVTGANGFIAGRTVEAYLKAGYNVRGTVRSEKSSKLILETLASYVSAGQFTIVLVPDITEPGAFDEAVKGVQAIAHLAAPVSFSFTDPVPVMHGAINGTRTLLESAHAHGKDLQTVVLCSSIVAVRTRGQEGHVFTEADWNETSEKNVAELGADASSIDIYAASKTAAEKEFWKFRDEKHPSFAQTAINPALVGGPPLLLTNDPKDINETVRPVWNVLSGSDGPGAIGEGIIVDVRDVARLFVFAVDHPEIAKNERYLAVGSAGPHQAVVDILREAYPERRALIKEGTPGAGYRPDFDIKWKVDASKAEKATGQKFIGFKDSILAAAKTFERYL
jgi:nucleoside-diphosphate-sugar epimerase